VTDQAENPNAAILAQLAAKAERNAQMVDVLFGGPQTQPSHERETEIEENDDE
jgi:hypothetical protein